MKKDTKGLIGQLGKLSTIGIQMVLSTFIGFGIGLYLDGKFETSPWLTMFFLIAGIAAGFKNMFSEIKKIDH